MKPTIQRAECATPDGSRMVLLEHDGDFLIQVDGQILMSSRQHESELELARLGCAHLVGRPAPTVLVGGLGMGYTVRQCLDLLGPDAAVTVCELIPDVVAWNRSFLGGLTGDPLRDPRVRVETADLVAFLRQHAGAFDALLLDIDNGPDAMTDRGNRRLYGREGISACCRALTPRGSMAVWSAVSDKGFEHALVRAGLAVRRYRAAAYKGSKSQARFVWVAAREASRLPPGGGAPRPPIKKQRRKAAGRRGRR